MIHIYMTCELDAQVQELGNLAAMYHKWLTANVGRYADQWLWRDCKINGSRYNNAIMFAFNREADAVMFKLAFSEFAMEARSVKFPR